MTISPVSAPEPTMDTEPNKNTPTEQDQPHDRRKEDENLAKARQYKQELEDMTDKERAIRKLEVEEEIAKCERKIRGKLASKIEDMKHNEHVQRLQNRRAEMLIIEQIDNDRDRKRSRRGRSKSKDKAVMDSPSTDPTTAGPPKAGLTTGLKEVNT